MLAALAGGVFSKMRRRDPPPWVFACFLTSVISWVALLFITALLECHGKRSCLQEWGRLPLEVAILALSIGTIALLIKVWTNLTALR